MKLINIITLISSLNLISSTNLKKDEYHYLVKRLTGIFKQDIKEFENVKGLHRYIQALEFDQDLSFYQFTNYLCNEKICPQFKLAPINGKYDLRKIKEMQKGQKGFSLILNSNGGQNNYTGKFIDKGNKLVLENNGTISTLNRINTDCYFNSKDDFCDSKVSGTVCSFENRCRFPGRFLTPCKVDSDCNSLYYCDAEDKVCRIPNQKKYKPKNQN
ncbi:hypothetical protein K502DRAFT_343303 [Neoconidiobolus thromboides FSU 785]|nr:hypothetical protein K502DRAFT_343303 [Neoconidiobolus thromboides FSU 785]